MSWRTSVPWWVVLIEGVVLAAIGGLMLLSSKKANGNVALILTVGLAVAAWLVLVTGIGLVGLAIRRQQKGDEAAAAIAAALSRVGVSTSATDVPGTEPRKLETPPS